VAGAGGCRFDLGGVGHAGGAGLFHVRVDSMSV